MPTEEERLDQATEKLIQNKVDNYNKKQEEKNTDTPPAADPPPVTDPPPADPPPVTDPPPASPPDPPPATTDIKVSDEKVTEITDKVKIDNPDKSPEELETLTKTALDTEKETLTKEAHKASSAEVIKKKFTEVKSREGNTEKSDDEIQKIVTEEIRSFKKTDPPPADPPGTVVQKEFNELLSDKTEGKYESIEELIAKAEEPKETVQLSDRLKKLYELEKSGVNVDKVLAFQKLGIDDLDPTDFEQAKKLLKIEMKLEDTTMTDSDMEHELGKKFNLVLKYGQDDEDKENPINKEAVENEKRSLIRQATRSKASLLETKTKYELPDSTANGQALKEASDKAIRELREQWTPQVDTALEGYNAVSINVEEGIDFTYQLNTDSLTTLKEALYDPVPKFVGRYAKDGVTDIAKMKRDIAITQDIEGFSKALWEQGKAAGQEELIRNTSNLALPVEQGTGNAPTDVKYKTAAEQMAAEMKASGEL